jgi:hypothetical protein
MEPIQAQLATMTQPNTLALAPERIASNAHRNGQATASSAANARRPGQYGASALHSRRIHIELTLSWLHATGPQTGPDPGVSRLGSCPSDKDGVESSPAPPPSLAVRTRSAGEERRRESTVE